MRTMADSINAANLPAMELLKRHHSSDPRTIARRIVAAMPGGMDLYAGYVDGRYQSYAPAVARFGARKVIPIAVFSTTNAGLVGDCETGDMTPATAVTWVVMRRRAGVDPTVYCSLALWGAVQAAFATAGVPQPHYWIAAYPGIGAALYPGAIAHQYVDTGAYDLSVVVDYWPGFDSAPVPGPAPTPPSPTHYPEDNVTSYPVIVAMKGGKGWIPSPVPAAKIVSVAFLTENPDDVARYDSVPTAWQIATEAGSHSPNGVVTVEGMVGDGNYGAVIWAAA